MVSHPLVIILAATVIVIDGCVTVNDPVPQPNNFHFGSGSLVYSCGQTKPTYSTAMSIPIWNTTRTPPEARKY
jgi:hypothetical protein